MSAFNPLRQLRHLVFLLAAILAACSSAPKHTSAPYAGPEAAHTALKLIGTPYRYGGADTRGFDCSGLIHYSYRQSGIQIPRTTRAQKQRARPVSVKHMQKGDLVFFKQEGKRYSHVGIYVGNGHFVHAPSSGKKVRKDKLSDPYWRKHFLDARRF